MRWREFLLLAAVDALRLDATQSFAAKLACEQAFNLDAASRFKGLRLALRFTLGQALCKPLGQTLFPRIQRAR
jgi:hypothetical protein